MKGYYKVPFRQVYCDTLREWLASVIECHVILKLRRTHLTLPTIPSAHDPAD